MEIKKNDKANLEKRRTESFLIGLIFALAALITVLEYSNHDKQEDFPHDFLDDLTEELNYLPTTKNKDMVTASAPQVSKAITSKITKVKQIQEHQEVESPVENPNSSQQEHSQPLTEQPNPAAPTPDVNDRSDVLTIVEKIPEFPGGITEFMKWLTRNLSYPEYALQQHIEGKVIVSFIVNKDGSIADPKVVKSVEPSLDNEALRVIKMMPKWKPGIMNGKPCRTLFSIPINFDL